MTEPTTPALKISDAAREAAVKVDEAFVVSHHAIPPLIQTAINEACKPLMDTLQACESALRSYQHGNSATKLAEEVADKVGDTLATHRRNHGPSSSYTHATAAPQTTRIETGS